GRPGHGNVLVTAFGHRHGVVLHGTGKPLAVGAQPRPRPPHLRAGHQHDVRAPLLDVHAGPVDQRLRNVATDAAVSGAETVGAYLLPEQQGGIAVVHRQHVYLTDRVHGEEHAHID